MNWATWTPSLLPAVVRFWNRAFAAKRNFFPVTEELWRRRVVEKRTAAERFDPKGFVAAVEGDEVVGLVHAGVRPESVCRALDGGWPGGTQGAVYFLYVEPARRRRGIGGELWHRAVERLKRAGQVVLDGQCLNPFYGNSEGPFPPFWGTPEGVAVEWTDSATQKFLARKGYAPRFKGVQYALEIPAGAAAGEGRAGKALERQGFELRCVAGEYPRVGRRAGERRPVAPGLEYECVTAVRGGRTAGLISWFPMKEVRPGLHAIYEAEVVEGLRGRALGRHLLEAAVGRMASRGAASCESLTIPELSPAAVKLYEKAGFRPAEKWAIY